MIALTVHHFLLIDAALFAIGLVGFLTRPATSSSCSTARRDDAPGGGHQLCALLARYRGNLQGQAFVLFILTVAACEAGIALALILMLYKTRRTLDISVWQDLREPDQDPVVDEEPLPPAPREGAPAAPRPRRPGTRTPSGEKPCLMCDRCCG